MSGWLTTIGIPPDICEPPVCGYAQRMTETDKHEARFRVGQVVRHKLFNYRGVIFDADATFRGTDEWYETMARSRPPKDRPWYHVLVHDAVHTTYVAERNLEQDPDAQPVRHPALGQFFSEWRDAHYVPRTKVN